MTPTSPAWYGNVLMISFAGLGEVDGEGETSGLGDSTGAVLGVASGDVDGLASGEFEACWLGKVQLANSNINPATTVAETLPPPLINP